MKTEIKIVELSPSEVYVLEGDWEIVETYSTATWNASFAPSNRFAVLRRVVTG